MESSYHAVYPDATHSTGGCGFGVLAKPPLPMSPRADIILTYQRSKLSVQQVNEYTGHFDRQ